jgi:nitrilase
MPATTKIRAAAVQIAPDLQSGAATLDKVIAAIEEAAGKGADLVVFPETFVPWYPYFSFVLPPVQSGATRSPFPAPRPCASPPPPARMASSSC